MNARARRRPGAAPVNWTRTKVDKTPPPEAPTARRPGCGCLLFAALALLVLAIVVIDGTPR